MKSDKHPSRARRKEMEREEEEWVNVDQKMNRW
jgi:hypothetical protein